MDRDREPPGGGATAAAKRIGVVGAGTMGAGIAQVAAAGGARVLLHDPVDGAAQRGAAAARDGLDRWRAKGRVDAGAAKRLHVAGDLADLAGCDLVVEAAPERLELKRELLATLSALAPGAVLASNTSSLPITALAGAAADPTRVVGMHFFNPVALMGLVEVVAGVASSAEALAVARATGAAMGKRVIEVADGPGFLVNRCNRPFGGEALELLSAGVAHAEVIDRIVRAAGFPLGPFELQDLVGLDVGLTVAESFWAQSYGEPRWRPSPLSARMVAAGRLGRKSGCGWYAYADGRALRPPDPPPVPVGGGERRLVVLSGETTLAHELRALADAADWRVEEAMGDDVPWLIVACGAAEEEGPPAQGAPQVLLCAEASLHQLDPSGNAAGFHALPPLDAGGLVELTRGTTTTELTVERAEAFFGALGLQTAWVGDAPGLVLGRIVAQLVNEAAFALTEGVTADPQAVDDAMELGLSHPRGPLGWGDEIGLDHVLTLLDALRSETGQERYRAAPLLRRMVADGHVGMAAGIGFHEYEEPDER